MDARRTLPDSAIRDLARLRVARRMKRAGAVVAVFENRTRGRNLVEAATDTRGEGGSMFETEIIEAVPAAEVRETISAPVTDVLYEVAKNRGPVVALRVKGTTREIALSRARRTTLGSRGGCDI